MARNLKALGLTLFAALAIGAMSASAATAEPFDFVSEIANPTITGSPDGKLTWGFDLGKVGCLHVTEEGAGGEATESPHEILTPTFAECTFAGIPANIDVNGCSFEYNTGEIEGGNFEGDMDIVCAPGKSVEFTAAGCTITLLAQNGLKKVTFTNKGEKKGREVTVDLNITGVSYEEDPVGMTPSCKKAKKANGTITGARTLTAENALKEMTGFWVE